MTATQLGQSMSSRELMQWMAYDRYRPATEADWQAARICQMIAAILFGFAGKSVPDLETFLPARARTGKPRGFTGLAMKAAFMASHAHLKPPDAKP